MAAPLRILWCLNREDRQPCYEADLDLANVKKLAGYEERYRLRVGDYRVLYEVTDGQLIILVVGVGHRREIYRAMP